MANLGIFLSHIREEGDLARYLKTRIEETFLGYVEVFVASDLKSGIQLGEKWLQTLDAAIRRANCILVLASSDSVARPWINFESGGGWFLDKRVIPLCHGGMVPAALPEPLRNLQAVDMTLPDRVKGLFTTLADLAGALEPPDIPSDEIALRFSAGLKETLMPAAAEDVRAQEMAEAAETLQVWRARPGGHIGETIVTPVRLGEFRDTDVQIAGAAGLQPDATLRIVLHLDAEQHVPFIEAMATGNNAEAIERMQPGSWAKVTLRLAESYKLTMRRSSFRGETIETEKYIPLVVIDAFHQSKDG